MIEKLKFILPVIGIIACLLIGYRLGRADGNEKLRQFQLEQ